MTYIDYLAPAERMHFTFHMYLCTTCVQCPEWTEEDVRSPGVKITDGCDLPYQCWELTPGPLEEQLLLLSTEPSLHP